MNVHFTYKLSKTPAVEQAIQQHIEKLNKRLQVFKPDMVSLHGSLEEGPKIGFIIALNLRLPTGQMAARGAAGTLPATIKSAFDELLDQLTRHKDQLRSQHKWPRERGVESPRPLSQVPFEKTVAAVQLEKISASDINGWIAANLPRLQSFIERELLHRRSSNLRHYDCLSSAEVLDEVIACALDDRKERPEKMALEHWLYRLARAAMDRLANQEHAHAGGVPLERGERSGDGADSDEAVLQFHQPDETVTNENLIADRRVESPEQLASDDEVVALVEHALKGTAPEVRESFLLFAIEGFTPHEIALITDREENDVRAGIKKAREILRKALPEHELLRDKLAARDRPA